MKRVLSKLIVICMVVALTLPQFVFAVGETQDSQDNKDTVSILFSHDMHSHMEKFPRIGTVIKDVREETENTFVFDAGDFSMGTPFQTIFKSDASELYMMGQLGYDAVTLGNHEFDYRSKGLAEMLNSAVKAAQEDARVIEEEKAPYVWNPQTFRWEKEKVDVDKLELALPELVISNIDWDGTLGDADLKEDGNNLMAALKKYKAGYEEKSYTVIEHGNAKIAVFGIFGKESASYAPESGTLFLDPVETAKKTVKAIKKNEKNIDLIVCLSHSGTNASNPESSEDEILAEEVDGIDLIVSGHSHTTLEEPIVINDTIIASAGQYNQNIGKITFEKNKGKYTMSSYDLIRLNSSIEDDLEIVLKVEEFKNTVNEKYFKKYGYTWDEKLADNDIEFTDIDEFGLEQGEDTLGNLIADSYIYGVKKAEGDNYQKVDVAIAPFGVIRGSFDKGKITTEDAFNALSLGTGKDGVAGYPLVSVYLTGAELKLVAEIDISVSELMVPARLYCSGLKYTYNPNRLFLNRAYDTVLQNKDGSTEKLENGKLYRVVADLYSAQMLSTVESMSKGILSLEPKDKDGNPIDDFEDHIIYCKDGKELKEWYALASYIDSFKGNKVPEKYAKTSDRKVLVDSKNILQLIKKPNKLARMLLAIIILVIAVIVLIIALIVRLIRGKNYGRGTVKKKDRIFSR
ncbi:MAG: 5'-nucleotidase C-terminal domain-containing protein [Eubacteriaceae bacterium]|nr:5'-nucleotidase C-terminal domain-containing protein [Eubacteriaceae bacterium]